jgi:cation:H+ antiporter
MAIMDPVAVALVVVGLPILLVGAELLVRGASRLARAAGISPVVVGLTVVAVGTSAPELAVNVTAVWGGPTSPSATSSDRTSRTSC